VTVSTTTSRADYTGNGVTTAFTVPFYFLDNTHVLVLRTQISTGATTTLALTTDYTMSGAGVSAGGTVTCVVAPTTDQKISVLRSVPLTQLIHYVPNDPFPAASHEQALDQLTMELQQLNEVQTRSLTLSKATSGVSATLPNPSASKVIGWDGSGAALVNYSAADLGASVALANWATQLFSGNGVLTTFTLSNDPSVASNCDISISGVTQVAGVDFNVIGTSVVFTAAPPSGTNNIAIRYGSSLPAGSVADASITTAKIVDGAVTAVKLASNAVTTAKITDANVTPAKLSAGAPTWLSNGLNKLTFAYYNSNTTSALDYTNGSHQRWAPSGTVTLSVTNWPASGSLGELLIEGVNLGAATITWPTINWVKSDGSTTTTFSGNGVTLQTSGTDFVILWTRDAGTTIYGKIVR
jgi:hypothetical protein